MLDLKLTHATRHLHLHNTNNNNNNIAVMDLGHLFSRSGHTSRSLLNGLPWSFCLLVLVICYEELNIESCVHPSFCRLFHNVLYQILIISIERSWQGGHHAHFDYERSGLQISAMNKIYTQIYTQDRFMYSRLRFSVACFQYFYQTRRFCLFSLTINCSKTALLNYRGNLGAANRKASCCENSFIAVPRARRNHRLYFRTFHDRTVLKHGNRQCTLASCRILVLFSESVSMPWGTF